MATGPNNDPHLLLPLDSMTDKNEGTNNLIAGLMEHLQPGYSPSWSVMSCSRRRKKDVNCFKKSGELYSDY